jgi:hypothetical protein
MKKIEKKPRKRPEEPGKLGDEGAEYITIIDSEENDQPIVESEEEPE